MICRIGSVYAFLTVCCISEKLLTNFCEITPQFLSSVLCKFHECLLRTVGGGVETSKPAVASSLNVTCRNMLLNTTIVVIEFY